MMKRFKLLTLAALLVLPLAACDEGTDDLVGTPVSGTVTGSVLIDGTGRSGITVSLSSGQTATTDANGRYTFNSVAAGAYTVSITSGVPSGVTFDALGKAAVITTSGQVVTVDFAGQSIRTSALTGTVSSGGSPLSGVTVTLSGAGTGSTTTDSNGQYSFGGLAAGSYTVTVSGLPDGVGCAQTSRSATLATGETQVLSFSCNPSGAGTISGTLFVDGNGNDVRDTGESTLAAGNVTITLEGPNIGETRTTVTAADGTFSFTDLVTGTYNVCVDEDDADIPSNFAFGGTNECQTRTLSGGSATVHFPFDIIGQVVQAYAFLGEDEDNPGVEPVEGVILDLFPTFDDAASGTNRLDRDTTDAGGMVSFNFDRADDTSPGAGSDRIVFAKFVASPDFTVLNGDTVIEIRYDDAVEMAPDTFDLYNTRVILGFRAMGGDAEDPNPLEGWNAALFRNDTTAPSIQAGVTGEDGYVWFTETTGVAQLPSTFYMRLSGAQPAAAGHSFQQFPDAEEDLATEAGRYLKYVHDGFNPVGDSLDVGNEVVVFATADLFGRAYHEQDDTAWYTAGDDFENADNIVVRLWRNGTVIRTDTAQSSDGSFTFTNIPTDEDDTYMVTARPLVAFQEIVSDSMWTVSNEFGGSLDGSTNAVLFCPLGADTLGTTASCASFAYKYNNGGVVGNVATADGTPVAGARIMISAADMFVGNQPNDTSVVTDSDGDYELTGLLEGMYYVSVVDSINADGDTIYTVFAPNQRTDTADIQGNADVDIIDFTVTRGDTEIRGVVVNDRDADTNTIDPGEALEGVTIDLYRDNSGTPTVNSDSLIATTTTDANGAYTFTNLFEGIYIVKANDPANAAVLRRFNSSGAKVDTAIAQTSGSPRVRGTTNPVPLPRWDYETSTAMNVGSTHFTFLYTNTEARGQVTDTGTGDPEPGVTVRLRRCDDSPVSGSPPPAGGCTTYFPGFTAQTTTTDGSGNYSFTNLQEGKYEVDIPSSTSVPANRLFRLDQAGDIDTGDFTIP